MWIRHIVSYCAEICARMFGRTADMRSKKDTNAKAPTVLRLIGSNSVVESQVMNLAMQDALTCAHHINPNNAGSQQ